MTLRRTCLLPSQLGTVEHLVLLISLALGVTGLSVPDGAVAQQVKKLEGHREAIYAVAYSPSGKLLVSGSFDNTVRIWNRATGEVLRVIEDHQQGVTSLAISPDARLLASGSLDRSVRLYDLPRLDPLSTLENQPGEVKCVAISQDGKFSLSGDSSKRVRVWQTEDNKLIREHTDNSAPPVSVAIKRDQSEVLALLSDGTLRGWRQDNGQATGSLCVPSAAAFVPSPDNRSMVLAGTDGALRVALWPPQASLEFSAVNATIRGAAFNNNASQVVTAGDDSFVRLYNIGDGKQQRELKMEQPVRAVSWSRNNQHIAAVCSEGRLRIWQAGDGKLLTSIQAHEGEARAVLFHPNSSQLATAGIDGMIRLWKLPLAITWETKRHSSKISAAVVAPNREWMLTGGDDKTAKLSNLRDGREIRSFGGHSSKVLSVGFRRDSGQLVTGCQDKKVRIFNTGDAKPQKTIQAKDQVQAVALHPNGQQVTFADTAGRLYVAEINKSKIVHEKNVSGGSAVALNYLPNGSLVAAAGKQLQFWNPGQGKVVGKIDVGTKLTTLAISPDGQLVAAGGDDKKIHLFQTGDRKRVAELTGLADRVTCVVFHHNRQRIFGGDKQGHICCWEIDSGHLLQKVQVDSDPVGIAPSQDDDFVVVASEDGRLQSESTGVVRAFRHDAEVNALAFANNGSQVLSAGDDKLVRLWNVGNGEEEKTFSGAGGPLRALTVTPDSQKVIAGGSDKRVRVWQQGDSKPVAELEVPTGVLGLSAANDNRRVVISSEDNVVRVYDLQRDLVLEEFRQASGAVRAVEFAADGNSLIAAGDDKRARLHRPAVSTGAVVVQSPIAAVGISPDGNQIYTASQDKKVAAWNKNDLNSQRTFDNSGDVNVALAVSADGRVLATGGRDRRLRMWDARNGQRIGEIETPAAITAAALNRQGQAVVVAGADHVIRCYGENRQKNQGNEVGFAITQQLTGHTAAVAGLALAADDKTFISGSADKTVRRWLVAQPTALRSLSGHGGLVYGLAFNSDGTKLASASSDKTVRLWQTADGKNSATLSGHEAPVYNVRWRPTGPAGNGVELATASSDATVRLWTAGGGQVQVLSAGIQDGLYSVSWSPDGQRMAAGGLGKLWHLWNLGQENPTRSVAGHNDYIYRVAFNPKGNRLATLGYGGTLYIWDVESGKQLHYQQLPLQAGYDLDYSPNGKELVLAGLSKDHAVLLVTVPGHAR